MPTGFASGVMGLSMLSGMGAMGAMQSQALIKAGHTGFGAVPGMIANVSGQGGMMNLGFRGTAGAMAGGLGRQVGYGMMAGAARLDPTSYMLSMGQRGMHAGLSTGQSMFGTAKYARLAGASRAPLAFGYGGGMRAAAQTTMHAFRGQGVRAGLGMAARFGGSAMMGAGGAVAGAALPVAAAYGAYKGLEYTGQQMYQGYQDTMMGQSLMNDIGRQVAPGRSMQGEGAATGNMMREMSSAMGMEMQDVGRFAKQLSDQKVFQTTRSAKEFREKFKKVMGAVTEIAQISQSSIDDAVKAFGDLRQQGFYTTADIKAEAASRQAREMVTGTSAGVMSAIGGVGAQQARAMGMRGRFGSRHAQQTYTGVQMGLRSGRMSEEEIMEMGGPEQAALRLSQKQMGFLGTARGRAMIAYSMGEGGAPDPERLQRMLGGGMSIESLVTGAAGRGLGVLSQAGTRESKEQMMQYAGMGMVSMAAMQQKQLRGGASYEGIIRHMGTMGVGREEAKLMYSQAMQMPEQLKAEQRAKEDDEERRRADALRYKESWGQTFAREWSPVRKFGQEIGQQTAGAYRRGMERLTGGEVYSEGGDRELARQARREGTQLTLGRGMAERRTMFGLTSASGRLQQQRYSARGRSSFDMSDDDFQSALDEGRIVDLGESATAEFGRGIAAGGSMLANALTGGRTGVSGMESSERYALRSELEGEESAYGRGLSGGLTTKQQRALRASLMRGGGARESRWGGAATGAAALGAAGAVTGVGAVAGAVVGGIGGALLDTSGLAQARSANLGGAGGAGWTGSAGALAMNLGVAGWDMTGTLGKLQTQSDTFTLAQQAGLISKDTSFGDWTRSTSAADKAKIEGQVRAGLETAAAKGDESAKATLRQFPQRETGLLQTRDLQAMKDDFAGKMEASLTGRFGHWLGGVRGKGNQKSLASLLSKDSKARQAYSEYMESLSQGKADAIDKLDALAEAFPGGRDSDEFKAAKAQWEVVDGMSDDEKETFAKEWKSGEGSWLKQRALGAATHEDNRKLRGRLAKISAEDRKNNPAIAAFEEAMGMTGGKGGTLDPDARARAMHGLFGGILDDGISKQEIAMLDKLSPGAGKKFGGMVGDLMTAEGDLSGSTVDEFSRLLGAKGKEGRAGVEERLRRIRTMKGGEQKDAIMALLQETGTMDIESFGMGAVGGKSRRGVQESYIEANEKFVQAVMAFVAGMKDVPGAPKFAAADAKAKAEELMAADGGVDTGTDG
jgi:hypothetical protein